MSSQYTTTTLVVYTFALLVVYSALNCSNEKITDKLKCKNILIWNCAIFKKNKIINVS